MSLAKKSLLVLFLFLQTNELWAQSGGMAISLIYEGGIGYLRVRGDACPGWELTTSQGRYILRERFGVFCPPVIPEPQAEYLFVLGPMKPGELVRVEWYGVGGEPPFGGAGMVFTVPEPEGKTLAQAGINAEGKAVFHVNGIARVKYVVEKTTDFESWTEIVSLVGPSDFVEPQAGSEAAFFRVRIEAPAPMSIPF